jgi:hypothetical protein
MKTLADFKKRIKIGVKLHTIHHQALAPHDVNKLLYDEDKGIREVSVVRKTQFALKTMHKDGLMVDSWLSFPKASECKIIDENTILIMCEDWRHNKNELIPLLTYKFITE